jgi:AcrR family transcriptional regulator
MYVSVHFYVKETMATTERGQQTRQRLIDATAVVVGAHGYAAATTRAIAAAAGVSEATIYRHFPDKTALFFAAVIERHTAVMEWMTQLPKRAGVSTINATLTETLHQLATLGADLAPLELAMLADPELARQRNVRDGMPPGPPAHLAEYLRREQSHGRIRSDVDPDKMALVVLATLFGIVAGQINTAMSTTNGLIDAAAIVLASGLVPQPSA